MGDLQPLYEKQRWVPISSLSKYIQTAERITYQTLNDKGEGQ